MSLIINNNTHTFPIRQEKFSDSSEILNFIEDCLGKYALSSKLRRKGAARVLDFLLYIHNQGFIPKLGRQTISKARGMNLSVKHVSRIVNEMERWGHITIVRRHKEAHTYHINELFFNAQIRIALRHLLPQLHDARLSRQKNEAQIMYNNRLLYMKTDITKVSHLKADSLKMSRNIIGNIYTENAALEKCDEVMTLTSYVPFDFDDCDMETRFPGPGLENTCPENISPEKKDPANKQPSIKKEMFVMQPKIPETVSVTSRLQSMKVTIWGQIRLCCYPDQAIEYADNQVLSVLSAGKKIDNVFKYFRAICEAYCKENMIEINWKDMIRLATQHAMPDEGPFIDVGFKPVLRPIFKNPTRQTRKITEKQRDPEKIQRNEEILKQFSQEACLRYKQRSDQETEHIRVNQPERFTRLQSKAQEFRQLLGIRDHSSANDVCDVLSEVANLVQL
jgi:hypothetical protein